MHIDRVMDGALADGSGKPPVADIREHIDACPMGIIGLNGNLEIETWTNLAAEITGVDGREVLGKPIGEVEWLPDELLERMPQKVADRNPSAGERDRFEVAITGRAGNRVNISGKVSTRYTKDGSLESVMIFLDDITEKKLYEQQLLEEKQLLERAQKICPLRMVEL